MNVCYLLLSSAIITFLGFYQARGSSIYVPQHFFEDDYESQDGNFSVDINSGISSGYDGASCNPPCKNGGVCLTHNTCQCPQEFKGPQCQYNSNTCSFRQLNFNGILNCSEKVDFLACVLSCPDEVEFEYPPAPLYVCNFAKGKFEPDAIPQCRYDMEINFVAVQKEREKREVNSGDKGALMSPNEHVDESILLEKQKHAGSCFTWSGSHIKTLDGKVYSFSSACAHILIRDAVDDTFMIVIQNSEDCLTNSENCYTLVKIYLQDKEYVLKRSAENIAIFTNGEKALPIPSRLPGIRADVSAHYLIVYLDSIGVKIKWGGEQFLQVDTNENLWNRTSGLCGTMDGDVSNDMLTKDKVQHMNIATFIASWQVNPVGDQCNNVEIEKHKCKGQNSNRKAAKKFCKKLFTDKRFAPCYAIMDIRLLFEACIWDYCSCVDKDPKVCACNTLNVYVRECAHKGITALAKWRDEETCPINCGNGKVYMPCAPPAGQMLCGGVSERFDESAECEEGCYCPEGMVLYNSKCITQENCPCVYHGNEYPSGATVPKDCNTCTCTGSKWICTEASCNARCTALGDPHYTTFDGKRFDFMGICSYYLVVHDNFTVETENLPCYSETISCVRAVTVKTGGHIIKLKQNRQVAVNGVEVTKLPFHSADVTIRDASSDIVMVQLPDGVEVSWNGVEKTYVDVPPTLKDKIKGLCGTYNSNQKDDFITPEGDVEQSAIAFANKWKTNENCGNIPDVVTSHPCSVNVYNKATAEEHCKIIKSDLFSDCHTHVDPESFYEDCMYDVCACNIEVTKCLCPMIGAYATECARKGIKIPWRNHIEGCGISCPSGQKYQICGNTCARSCYDISTVQNCRQQCIEGCNCPDGEALDNNAECIPIAQCGCRYNGLDFPTNYKAVRPAITAPELCICINAQWSCKQATPDDIKKYPNMHALTTQCNATENKEFTTCEPVEPVTCKNMHSMEPVTTAVCHAGCKCKTGYVLDTYSKTCVKPEECPCHHGGQSYSTNSIIHNECNTCKCKQGQWKCTDKICPGECTTWGDSHYKTFDGKLYDYQGQCYYALAKGSLGNDQSFDISIQSIPCGSLDVSCSKSVTVRVGTPPNQESITLTREKNIPEYDTLKQLLLRQVGHFVIIEAPELGVLVRWDKGTRIYVKLYAQWKNKVQGLCGNYNDNELDDFQTPSGGIPEVSSRLFGDSWRLQPHCLDAVEITDTCQPNPNRKVWALQKCGILKSSVFAACHSEVPVETYLNRCIFDTCACDQGGDCECLCTALAAYAQECNNRGVAVRWRTPELCPMQCDERCTQYSPCISTCPTETCDNMWQYGQLSKLCHQDSCVEGCQAKPCPEGFIYSNSSLLECIPKKVCVPLCLEVNGVTYYEGDLMEDDECHSCYCSRGKKLCQGQRCLTVTSTPVYPETEPMNCVSGWTAWMNQDKQSEKDLEKLTDIEPLPESLLMNNLEGASHCEIEDMVNIECRTVESHITSKETGLDVECSLEHGLICKPSEDGKPCLDFEIRVKCKCGLGKGKKKPVKPSGLCDVTEANREHPSDCRLFYYCEPGEEPNWVEKVCGPEMLFNPEKGECDSLDAVVEIKPNCKSEVPTICSRGEEYKDCAIECHRLCDYYLHVVKESGHCLSTTKCEPGCVSPGQQLTCPPRMLWANDETCVVEQDCMCLSYEHKPIKPGVVVKESECKSCQCIDNYYACDESACVTPTIPSSKEEESLIPEEITTIGIVSTVTPPAECKDEDFTHLIDGDKPLPDEAFSASSALNDRFSPKHARLSSDSSWIPERSDKTQYLQIMFPQQEPVYGVIIKGNPKQDEYVTSYWIEYSADGHSLNVINNKDRAPKTFRGSIDGNTAIKEFFDVPIEAKIIRITPQTWHESIALRIELIGCSKVTVGHVTKPTPICVDPMGINNGVMADQQIFVSSERDAHHNKNQLKIDGKFAWQPVTNSPFEWVQFDFMGPRNLTGLVTRGGHHGWVSAFNVKYSHDGKEWSAVLDGEGNERVFLGNVDENTRQVINFDLPLQASFLKIVPVKWHKNIQLRIELYGCFVGYPAVTPATPISPLKCNDCSGVVTELGVCQCHNALWWDGKTCVERSQCPCMVGHVPYSVGTFFTNEDCANCTCKLGGVPHCTPKVCSECGENLRGVVTKTCGCICEPCKDGTVLCPTSNICINSADWCNGVVDCPDDETSCVSSTAMPFITEAPVTTAKPEKCPTPTCQSGYKVVIRKTKKAWRNPRTMFSSHTKTSHVKGTRSKIEREFDEENIEPLPNKITDQNECPAFDCVPIRLPEFLGATREPCPEIVCPSGYFVDEIEPSSSQELCPMYICTLLPPRDTVCNVTGRTFNTFDGTEYKYDVCNHILVRDLFNNKWEVSLKKNCTVMCTNNLVIRHDDHTFNFHPDLSIDYDGYWYTTEHIKKIEANSNSFEINLIGEALVFVSNDHGFWVIWDNQGNAKIGVSSELLEKTDGLCGYFNDNPHDDKRKPDGAVARTTAEFVDSWAHPDQPICEAKACPLHVQKEALDMCNLVKEGTFAPCSKAVDVDAFVSRCLETTCTCLEAAAGSKEAGEKCRCSILQQFVVNCLTANSDLDVIDWRMKHDCPAACEAPLVHHDCYRRRCEPSCGSLNTDLCPKLNHICFPGCYCPAGYVRKGDNCILPTSCGDCECNVLPHLAYETYDKSNFTVDGNCVYIMSQDVPSKDEAHKFQVLITNRPCEHNNDKMCIGKVTVLHDGQEIDITRDLHHRKLKVRVNSKTLTDFAEVEKWAHIKADPTKHLRILLHKIQVHISVYYPSLGASVKAPSLKYGNRLEGLCGDCNGDPGNDFSTPNKEVAADANELGLSWLYENQNKADCGNQPELICVETEGFDPCVQLERDEKYRQCNPVLKPGLFVEWCKKDTCNGRPALTCGAMEAYSHECGHLGFCIDWRTDLCPAKQCPPSQEYRACGPACSQTCENYKLGEKNCTDPPIEGCFCPEGKVFLNNTCVVEERCEACDDEGHRSGDEWRKDACTTCRCEGMSVTCETQKCPIVETICEEGFEMQKVSTPADCCDKFKCLQTTVLISPTCEPPQEPVCSAGQVMKSRRTANDCRRYICECVPIEECEPIDERSLENSEPGIEKVVDDTGCCPVIIETCKMELCLEPPITCPQFHSPKSTTVPEKCCPSYSCKRPEGTCLVDLQFIASEEGGERPRNENEKHQALRQSGEIWQDGPCRSCKCIAKSEGDYHDVCTVTECPILEDASDYDDYLLEPEPIVDQCCPNIRRAACKYNGNIYEAGKKWTPEGDDCTTIECVYNFVGIEKVTQVQTCDTKCEIGWEYNPPLPESKTCCGSCKPVACVLDENFFKIGEEWTSPDYCTNYLCSSTNGSVQIQSSEINCPELSRDILEEYVVEVITVKGECCKSQKVVACKVGDEEFKVGESWPSPDGNKCKRVICIENALGEIVKQESVETCNRNCSKGWTYQESYSKCCGECVQEACFADNELRRPDEEWMSADGCVTFSCSVNVDQFMVTSQQETCPNIDKCPAEDIYYAGCCKHCNITSRPHVICDVQRIDSVDTIGLVVEYQIPDIRCVNEEPIEGFTKCSGMCESHTSFNSEAGIHESVCSCCKAVEYQTLDIPLKCTNGRTFEKAVDIPIECRCDPCSNSNLPDIEAV